MKAGIFEVNSPAETYELGQALGETATAGEVIALVGDLGSGKTVLAQGIAAGLGVAETVGSPTFLLLREYEGGRLPLYHFDVYRINEICEMDDLGFDEYMDGDGLTVIEWAEKVAALLPPRHLRVTIEKNLQKGLDYRKVTMAYENFSS
jgi:tRNA threonylcarbamoyladenosine biosynthesis protein TsaE